MFTGIVETAGSIESIEKLENSSKITIASGDLDMGDVKLGDSIAVNGACLTVVDFDAARFSVDVSPETLACQAPNVDARLQSQSIRDGVRSARSRRLGALSGCS